MQPLKKIIAGTALTGALITGCGNPTPKAENDSYAGAAQTVSNGTHEGVQQLQKVSAAEGLQFLGNDGRPVNLNGLQAKFSGQPSTISFMFTLSSCGSTCPQTAAALNDLAEKNPSLHHYIINVHPNPFDVAQSALLNELEAFPNLKGKITVLTPVAKLGSDVYSHQYASPEQIVKIENGMNTLPLGKDYRRHTGEVIVYGNQGQLLKLDPKDPDDNSVQQSNAVQMAKDIQERLNTQTIQPQRQR